MKINDIQIPEGAINEMRSWILANDFTNSMAVAYGEKILAHYGADLVPHAHRVTDRMIQKMRKEGLIAFKHVKGQGNIWKAVA